MSRKAHRLSSRGKFRAKLVRLLGFMPENTSKRGGYPVTTEELHKWAVERRKNIGKFKVGGLR